MAERPETGKEGQLNMPERGNTDRSEHKAALHAPDPVVAFLRSKGIVANAEQLRSVAAELGHEEVEVRAEEHEPVEYHEPVEQPFEEEATVETSAEASVSTSEPGELSPFLSWLAGLPVAHTTAKPPVEAREETVSTSVPEIPKEVDNQRDTSEEPKPDKKKSKKHKGQSESYSDGTRIDLDKDIASETLAALLASQGHIDEAIDMYERLRLKYPEKSRFFAAKIETLKEKG